MREFPKQKVHSLYLSIPKLVMKMDKGVCFFFFFDGQVFITLVFFKISRNQMIAQFPKYINRII